MTIAPIETRYAGHRFRSRLEARWAVCFDRLGIKWLYEPEGYQVGSPDPRPYLPDFWLPEPGIWVEVKGTEDQLDVGLIVEAALPHYGLPGGGLEIDGHRPRLLILGPHGRIGRYASSTGSPDVWVQPSHTLLSFHKGDLFQGSAWFTSHGLCLHPSGGLVANDGSGIFWATRGVKWGNWVNGGCAISDIDRGDQGVQAAYRGACSARFEHGERG